MRNLFTPQEVGADIISRELKKIMALEVVAPILKALPFTETKMKLPDVIPDQKKGR